MKRALGTALVVAGLLVLADAAVTLAWQEPLSALRAARAQHHLAAQLQRARAAAPPRRRARTAPARWPRRRARSRARAATARRVAELRIARIGLRAIVVRGTTPADLREGPGLIAGTPLPGSAARRPSPGTARPTAPRSATSTRCAAATRSRCACPTRSFRYRVEGRRIVDPGDLSVLRRVGHDRLVLSACHPLFSAARRIVVLARLTGVGQSARSVGTDA